MSSVTCLKTSKLLRNGRKGMVDIVQVSPREKKTILCAKQSNRVTSQFHQNWLIDQKGSILPEQCSDMFINRKSSLFSLFFC